MKDYLKEFTRFLAISFCEFEAEKNIDTIRKNVRKSNLDTLFDDYSFRLTFNNMISQSFFSTFRNHVDDYIVKEDHSYAMTRFVIVECIHDSTVYGHFLNGLFKESKWYKDCLNFANEVCINILNDSDYTWDVVYEEWKTLDEKSKEKINKKLFE